jgi:hypothetical protein
MLEIAKRLGEPTEEMKMKFANFPDTLEELEELLSADQSKVGLIHDTDEGAVIAFNTRRKEVEFRNQSEGLAQARHFMSIAINAICLD